MQKRIRCNACAGTGGFPCPRCNGAGTVWEQEYDHYMKQSCDVSKPCPRCGGVKELCAVCGGRGWLPAKPS